MTNHKGAISKSLEPKKNSVEVSTGDCVFLLWGCKSISTEITESGEIKAWVKGAVSTKEIKYGSLKLNQIVTSKNESIRINREKNEVVRESSQDQFFFSPACENRQVAVAVSALDLLQSLN